MYGDVTFRLGGAYYTVRYPNAAWDELKARFSVTSEVECLRQTTAAAVHVIVGAGLAARHPLLTPEDVIHIHARTPGPGERSLVDACYAAIGLSFPEPKAETAGDGKDTSRPAPKPDAHALRREALKAGLTPSEFSAITPREAVMAIEGSAWRQTQGLRVALTTAWHTEAFARTKRLEPLDNILKRVDRAQKPDDPAAAAADRAERARAWFARAATLRQES